MDQPWRSWQFRAVVSLLWAPAAALVMAQPASASRLQLWRLNPATNQLEIRTERAVQPRAELVYNPTRLVIDLPGVVLGSPQISQNYSGAIRQVRVAQFDPQTTRIVVEYADGFTIDPQQVRFRGVTANNWLVQLPTPQQQTVSLPPPPPPSPPSAPPVTPTGPLQVRSWRADATGFLVLADRPLPEGSYTLRRPRRDRIEILLSNSELIRNFSPRRLELRRFGRDRVRAEVRTQSNRQVQITLDIDPQDADWQVTPRYDGFLIVPSTTAITPPPPPPSQRPSVIPAASAQTPVTTIQRVDLGGRELLIQGDRTVFYNVGWEGNRYRIRLRQAQLDSNLREPRLVTGSPLSNIEFRQEDNQTVSILLTPAPNFRILGPRPLSAEAFVVQIQGANDPPSSTPTPIDIPPTATPQPPNQPVPRGRFVVVIDPGHGGRDPGAIGIGGIREKDIVLDISLQVSQFLQQQGVQVILTRTTDIDLDLAPRVAIAERARANAFVSIHANAISLARPDVNGLETYFAPGRSSRLASAIHNSILNSLNIRDRGVRAARFYVIRNTSMDSALVETGFVTGAEDAANFKNPAWRTQMARAIAQGILNFLHGR
ncbi:MULTISPECIES: N-acetylmuramoyl-L-alanine amidase [unclassified Thermosynechococcus]|uniref:N-acetylmuramoyl-L-alanine amidase n=1 Tax=unclassified Thermosynechococcus TaxID=2622553 RepID=UPI00197D9466|nr:MULTISPECIES: N-acetylmuramoyl-L-alanine amidase [unclassified Thermosynechococcus]QSF49838.1 N-acetylmuramoyl-L-alanine amidase [Thermosynechococcus sp. TA-1]WNC22934.1 N-acetylmuramoyl-L-alanine amidase [Thermosynechococcus sp. PP22]WNC33177.1 N-acetylmuramoyl-L-alanine amidase [Thermosynechococcus sp. PKX95]WNC35701.1 N-acetylmuramoyl-L-alanine amidase [Thermosynechococcus sp. PKX91]WNC38225.1 N-acetylmuramoyl-L-alanine amidase [Thermosynechococcus sp. WL11]